jgi:CheY-like chemotaxis protein
VPELLLVEDDPAVGEQLAEALTSHGHHVRRAGTGRQALGQIPRAGTVDLILLDLGLPDLDGTALCRQMRSALPDTTIVIITAHAGEIDVVPGLDADDYLTWQRSVTRAHHSRSRPRHASTALPFCSPFADPISYHTQALGQELLETSLILNQCPPQFIAGGIKLHQDAWRLSQN